MININIRKIIWWLAIILLALTTLNLVFFYLHNNKPDSLLINNFNNLFDTNMESNIPTCFSAILIFINALVLALIGKYTKNNKINYWYLLSGIMLYLSIDELTIIHEKINTEITAYNFLNSFWGSGWAGLYVIFAIIIFILFIGFIIDLPKNTRNLILLAGIIYVFGAAGLEFIGGIYAESFVVYKYLTTVEEALESGAMIIFCYALIDYLYINHSSIKFKLEK